MRFLPLLLPVSCAALLLAGCQSLPATQGSATAAGPARLVPVAHFDHQVTGVTVTPRGRIFVNFPRWTEDAPVSVAEVLPGGGMRPYPDAGWNAWRNSLKDQVSAGDHWVCVQSVFADRQGNLWVVDPAAPGQDKVVPGGPKLVKIDTATDRVAQTIAFDESVAPQGSYLNDVRISPDGRTAYLTDSGARGAIVVVDLGTGRARRVLDGHPSTQAEKDVQVKADGQVLRRPDGRGVEFSADGIAQSQDGAWLYWQAIKGKTLYRVPTAALRDAAMAGGQLAAQVQRVGENGPADGLLLDARNRMYVSAVEENAVKLRDGDRLTVLVQDPRLRWPDTFAEGPDGAVYVTASRIQDMNWFKPGNPAALPTTLFRIER
jgi:sugar lactone lactonase YvrE